MIASNRTCLHVIENHNSPPAKAMRKMINALSTLDHPVKQLETPQEAAEGVSDAKLDGVSRWPPVADEKRGIPGSLESEGERV